MSQSKFRKLLEDTIANTSLIEATPEEEQNWNAELAHLYMRHLYLDAFIEKYIPEQRKEIYANIAQTEFVYPYDIVNVQEQEIYQRILRNDKVEEEYLESFGTYYLTSEEDGDTELPYPYLL